MIPFVIEDNVWIGINSTILPGVRIGYGAVVGAGSVVTKVSGDDNRMPQPARTSKDRNQANNIMAVS